MKNKVKLKVEFLNAAVMIVGTTYAEIQVEYPASQMQIVAVAIKGNIKPCMLVGVRLMRVDGSHLVTVPLGSIFVGENKLMDFTVGMELSPKHVEFLSQIPA